MGFGWDAGLRDLADEVRVLPLGEVAVLLGYRRDASDRSRWRREGSVISVTGMKFYDHLQGRGGGGAIDLVIHARGCDHFTTLGGAGNPSSDQIKAEGSVLTDTVWTWVEHMLPGQAHDLTAVPEPSGEPAVRDSDRGQDVRCGLAA